MSRDMQSAMSTPTTENMKGRDEHNGPAPDESRRLLEEEFNVQRAKMKELFLQKEEEMRKIRSEKEQLESEVLGLRAELQQQQVLSENQRYEIQSLQMLVNETVEASSSGTEEVRRLRARTIELEQHLNQMRQYQQQQEVSLAPATLVRNLARKFGADAEEQPQRRNQEDDELMNSMVHPLVMEIEALKTKLRDTDTQLQEALAKEKAPASTNASGDIKQETEAPKQCDMCANYEQQLVLEQKNAEQHRDRANMLDTALKQATEELEGVRSIHDETIRSWTSERQSSSSQLEALQSAVQVARSTLEEKAAEAQRASQRALQAVTDLTVERETLQKKLDSLESDNAMLIGEYLKKAEEMQNEVIDLPNTIEELQELCLRQREELVLSGVGREQARAAERELREQLLQHAALFREQDDLLRTRTHELRTAQEDLDRLQTEREQMSSLGDKLRQATETIERLSRDKARGARDEHELRARMLALQQELDNSEKVQQDFVRLSQSLQVQLQRIREADTEVRWQYEEDVQECPACHTHLPNSKKKMHCRHCGRIFCPPCVSAVVPAGPRGAPARVCAVCRTLLQPHAAPYFSTAPPRSPD